MEGILDGLCSINGPKSRQKFLVFCHGWMGLHVSGAALPRKQNYRAHPTMQDVRRYWCHVNHDGNDDQDLFISGSVYIAHICMGNDPGHLRYRVKTVRRACCTKYRLSHLKEFFFQSKHASFLFIHFFIPNFRSNNSQIFVFLTV